MIAERVNRYLSKASGTHGPSTAGTPPCGETQVVEWVFVTGYFDTDTYTKNPIQLKIIDLDFNKSISHINII